MRDRAIYTGNSDKGAGGTTDIGNTTSLKEALSVN
jgi:hypothetical protein